VPIIRADIPTGQSDEAKAVLRNRIRDAVARTWATEHIYIAIGEMFTDPDDVQAIVTVDLREGRGHEKKRSELLHRMIRDSLNDVLNPRPHSFVLLIRQLPAEAFATEGGELPPLSAITPDLTGIE